MLACMGFSRVPPDARRRRLCQAALAATCVPAPAVQARLVAAPLVDAERAVRAALATGRPPGAVLWIERDGDVFHRAWGQRAVEPAAEAAELDTVYDIASLTKPVTAALVMRLAEERALSLDDPLRRWWPSIVAGEPVTVRHLLTHTAGLPASLPLDAPWQGSDRALDLALAQAPTHAPGSFFRYSDVGFILLGALVERVGGQPLDALAQAWVLQPLRMGDTRYRPLQSLPAARIAPTEFDGGRPLRGEVHDPTARRMGGVAGHAGLFGTAADMARFARMVLGGGELDGARVLASASVDQMTRVNTPSALAARRGLGWDIDSPYSRPRGKVWPAGRSFGHTGFTGCAMWIDPGSRSFYVLLSNRVHPRGGPSIVPLYEQIGTQAALAAGVTAP